MFLSRKRQLTALALALLLSGCGGAAPQVRSDLATTAQASSLEKIPSAADLRRLELGSPDYLVENAAAEPGTEGLWPKPPAEDLGNFAKVESTLWRGARPTEKGLVQLKSQGVKTIVNFENDKKVVQSEEAWCKANGVNFVSIPLSIITPPKLEKVKQFLALANDPNARPLYFHCMQGRDRTGTAAFAYRISHDGWDYDRAYQEMVSFKFHTYLVGLRGFLVWYAHTQKPAAGTLAVH